jgi:hypothetical protein
MDLAQGKERLNIHGLWRLLDLPGDPKVCRRSPFREDKSASFSVSRDGLLFNDFATGEAGDAIDFLQIATGLSREAACRKFLEMAGGAASSPLPAKRTPPATPQARQKPYLPMMRRGAAADFKRLARLRNVSIEGLQLASERGLLWFAELRGFDSWIVSDGERWNAQARRLDGGTWEHLPGNPKAWTLPGSRAAWPIGTKEAQPFKAVALVEGGGDLIAACHFVFCEDRERDVAPVAILGAANSIPADALPLLAGKRVRLFPHTDSAGQEAAANWTRQLESAGADVDEFDFAGLHRTDGADVGDLNDLAYISPDDFEAERETWAVLP